MNAQMRLNWMPSDFEDTEGWNSYYVACQEAGEYLATGEIRWNLMPAYFVYRKYIHHSHQKIWFPGCGASLAPHVYAALGFKVWASDFSKVAIEIQEQLRQLPVSEIMQRKALQKNVVSSLSGGELHLCVHDFREPFDEGDFDTILNIKAFPRLSPRNRELVAAVHWRALKPKGQAIFWINNGIREYSLDLIEPPLIKARFLVPGHQTYRWHRRARAVQNMLAKVLKAGFARLGRGAERQAGRLGMTLSQWDGSLDAEFQKRIAHEEAAIQHMLNTRSDIKVGRVIYFSL
jgi:hypothetical protein